MVYLLQLRESIPAGRRDSLNWELPLYSIQYADSSLSSSIGRSKHAEKLTDICRVGINPTVAAESPTSCDTGVPRRVSGWRLATGDWREAAMLVLRAVLRGSTDHYFA